MVTRARILLTPLLCFSVSFIVYAQTLTNPYAKFSMDQKEFQLYLQDVQQSLHATEEIIALVELQRFPVHDYERKHLDFWQTLLYEQTKLIREELWPSLRNTEPSLTDSILLLTNLIDLERTIDTLSQQLLDAGLNSGDKFIMERGAAWSRSLRPRISKLGNQRRTLQGYVVWRAHSADQCVSN
jgi:hypothetical protein